MRKPFSATARSFVRLIALACFVALAGCDRSDDKITVYRIPKEQEKIPAAPPAALNAAPGSLHWTAPTGWEEQPASGFRKGSFLVRGPDGKQADVSIISFPESAGGVLANVNRWRDQLKLAPVSDVTQAGTEFSVNNHSVFFVDLVSEAPIKGGEKSRILGGIFPLSGETWFFKMMGPDQLVESQRAAFKKFLESVEVGENTAPVSTPMTANTGASTNAPTPPMLAQADNAPLHYTLPASWQEKPLTPMRVASFNAGAANGKPADVSVVSLGGMAGGDLANVNRWRDQVKLPPIDETELIKTAEHVSANGRDYLVVDIVSTEPIGESKEKQRIIAAVADETDRSWFVKMIGPDETVAAQKTAFLDFLRSLKIP